MVEYEPEGEVQEARDKVELKISAKGDIQPIIRIGADSLLDKDQQVKVADALRDVMNELKARFPTLRVDTK